MAENFIRQLTQDEYNIYTTALQNINNSTRDVFLDVLAMMRPMFDSTAQTAYVDPHARIGLSTWFFNLPPRQMQFAVLHEALHIINRHFERAEALNIHNQMLMNIAGDFESNSLLKHMAIKDDDLGDMILPDKNQFGKYPNNLTFEQYVKLLEDKLDKEKDTPKNSSQNGDSSDANEDSGQSQSGQSSTESQEGADGKSDSSYQSNGSSKNSDGKSVTKDGSDASPGANGCDAATAEREKAADDALIERASETEQGITKQNTKARMEEQAAKDRKYGSSALGNLIDFTLKQLAPPVVSWKKVFTKKFASSVSTVIRGKTDYSYEEPDTEIRSGKLIFPGMIAYAVKVMMGFDTSGSMRNDDYLRGLGELAEIIKHVIKNTKELKFVSIDTEIKEVESIRSIKDIKFKGGGGTEMSPFWKFIDKMPKREKPDIAVLITDGGLNWKPIENELVKSKKKLISFILITDKEAMKYVNPVVKKLATVIDISGK